MNSGVVIAERKLLYSPKGSSDRRPFTVRLSAPVLIGKETKSFPVDEGAASCTLQFDGLNEVSFDVHGIDLIHALAQAANIDGYLRAMTNKYDFYWLSGEPYFDDA